MTQAQLAWYREMEARGELSAVTSRATLDAHLARLEGEGIAASPIGYIRSLEGADSLVTIDHLHRAWESGLRAVGPAHYGPGTYAQGTDASGGLGERGRELLRAMRELGMILDATHLCDDSFWEALEQFDGTIWASHHNCRALVPHNRQASDEMIRALVSRGAVIGVALDAWMIVPGWVRGQSTPEGLGVTLDRLADHVDHICQVAGDAAHVGIGSDLDGAFGREQTAADISTIADLARLLERLRARGYREADVTAIAHGNFLACLRRGLPA
jgi:membrane dipeptidase